MTKSVNAEVDIASTPVAETKAALTELVSDLRGFQDRIETRLKAQDDRLTMLDRKSVARPALGAAAAETSPHRKALSAYLRSGDESGLRGAALSSKMLNTGAPNDGGYLVDPQSSDQIANLRAACGSLRAVANVVQIGGGAYEVLIDRHDAATAWLSETSSAEETASGTIERVTIPLHELAALPKASQRLLEDSAFDVESWLAEALAARFASAEAAAFINGDGSEKPTGLLAHPTAPAETAVWGQIGYVATGAAGDFSAGDPTDCVVDLVYSLGARYRGRGAFVMNSATAGALRKMKDAEGRFIWADTLACGQPATILGYPVVTCEEMPTIGDGAFAIAFGDFKAGYTIAEKPDIRILRDPYSAKPNVQFYASARVGGDVTDFEAIRLLRFAAS